MRKKNVSFTICGVNRNAGLQINIEVAMLVNRAKGQGANKNMTSRHGTVLLGKVIHGIIRPGIEIKMKFPRGNEHDTIVSLEENRKAIPTASAGQEVGIALQKSTLQNILEFM